jgi:hypothetical protein
MTTQVNHMETRSKASFLTTVLRADGVFSLVSAAITILASRPVAEMIGLETPGALVVLGLVLLGYGAMLVFFADRSPANRRVAQIAVVLNMLWVIDSYAGLLVGFFPVNTAGKWAIALIAEAVFVFGVLQIVALRRLSKRG